MAPEFYLLKTSGSTQPGAIIGLQKHSEASTRGLQEPQVTRVRSLGWDDPLEEGMATHSSILAWRMQWTEEPCGQLSIG